MAAKPKPDVMIDIETLALSPDALVLSIGAIQFDCLNPSGPWFGDTFFRTLDITTQLIMGRAVDRKTQAWWRDQERDKARLHWQCPSPDTHATPQNMLVDLAAFVAGAERVWAHGVVFDISVLQHMYEQTHTAVPWSYRAVRDTRTFFDTHKVHAPGAPPDTESIIEHHPLGDCRLQIKRLWMHGYQQE